MLGGGHEDSPVMILAVEVVQKLFEYVIYLTIDFDQGENASLAGEVGCDGL